LRKLIKSKEDNRNLKILLTLGSYDTKSYGFDSITDPNDTKIMKRFALKLVKFLRQFNFDGVLIDFEFPNMKDRGSPLHTKSGFSILLKVNIILLCYISIKTIKTYNDFNRRLEKSLKKKLFHQKKEKN
jgi:GH18 family chitinase